MRKTFMSIKEIREVPDNLIQKLKIPVYHEEDENKTSMKPKKSKEERMTLSKLAVEMRENFNKVNDRIDHLETRIDRIDTRLDYIVQANNLKDHSQNK